MKLSNIVIKIQCYLIVNKRRYRIYTNNEMLSVCQLFINIGVAIELAWRVAYQWMYLGDKVSYGPRECITAWIQYILRGRYDLFEGCVPRWEIAVTT